MYPAGGGAERLRQRDIAHGSISVKNDHLGFPRNGGRAIDSVAPAGSYEFDTNKMCSSGSDGLVILAKPTTSGGG